MQINVEFLYCVYCVECTIFNHRLKYNNVHASSQCSPLFVMYMKLN